MTPAAEVMPGSQGSRFSQAALPRPLTRFHISTEGRYWLLTALLLLGIGLYKSINLLSLVGSFLLALWGLSALLAGRRVRKLRVQRRLNSPVFAGRPFPVEVTVANPTNATVWAIQVRDGGPAAADWFLTGLRPGEVLHLRRDETLRRRGRYAWGPVLGMSGYPLGLARRTALLAPGEELLVYPSRGYLHRGRFRRFLVSSGAAGVWTWVQGRRHPTAQDEFHGLRTFRTGDSQRHIHWRTSARCGELMVREFEDLPTDHLILIVDAVAPVAENGAPRAEVPVRPALEEALSFAATVCWEWCRQHGERLVLAVHGSEPAVLDGTTGELFALRLLECLAVQTGDPPRSGEDIVAQLAARALPRAPVVLVSAGPTRLDRALEDRLHRPVVSLEPARLAEVDFYERPAAHAL